ncbi:MAG: TRAP transporter substrate-binding protein [Cypionkella sp.]
MTRLISATALLRGASLAAAFAATISTAGAQDITLRGASMFDENHAFTKTLERFADLVKEKYQGDVTFDLRLNGELGVEADYVTFLQQGVAIDYTIMAPSNMATFAPSIPLMDMPFLFRDQAHWEAVLSSNVLKPLEDELLAKADIMVIGYTGGGVRNIISNHPIHNLDELSGFKMRVMGAPIQAQIFSALTAAPSAIAYNEVYNAIQTGVISGFENEAASIQNLKFYEVAPYLSLTRHAITVRPIVMSGKTFRKLPEALQTAVLAAGKEAGAFGRELETREDGQKLKEMADAGQLTVVEFEDRDKLLKMVVPVQDEYAAQLGATDLLTAIRGM